ncbi:hypothetical protein K661_00978 [Piscirickettsia salmonis LF-89 = ATCC VR-1361]|nr:hypothetical protein K661_00978 [Piscirickettsia salmonis LF-89 = ATCC VR-1361]
MRGIQQKVSGISTLLNLPVIVGVMMRESIRFFEQVNSSLKLDMLLYYFLIG